MGGLGSNNKTEEEDGNKGKNMEIRSGGQARKDGWMKGKEGEMKRKTERDAEGPRERPSRPEWAV